MSICLVEECFESGHSHGLCTAHAHRFRRYGNPTGRPNLPTLEQRFWGKVVKGPECWEWQGARSTKGYGTISVGGRAGRMEVAARVAWAFVNGPIPEGLEIRHSCDNPPCVRPDHLLIGSHRDNMRDMVARNRQSKGSRFSHARLTEDRVAQLRQRYEAGGVTQRALAQQFGVSQTVVSGVLLRKSWRHVP